MRNLPDDALVDRVVALHDAEAFGVLYERHAPVMYAVALRLTGNRDEAEDVVHDAWMRVADKLQAFSARSTLRTWLVGFIVNRWRESRRSRASWTVELLDDTASGKPAALPHHVDPIDLDAAIKSMPAGYREVIVLHDVEGFTHEEIASMLGIELGTSKSQLARGRAWLRQALDGGDPE